MEDISIVNTHDFKKFVYDLHRLMIKKKISIVYEGDVNQSVVKTFTSITERKMELSETEKIKKKVYHVMVECLQNISKHTDDERTGDPLLTGQGIFMVAHDRDGYVVVTGNVIANKRIDKFKQLTDNVNQLEPDELKDLYKKILREGAISEKAGAGLGLIDIVKKTGNPIDYKIQEINDKTSFLLMVSKVNRI